MTDRMALLVEAAALKFMAEKVAEASAKNRAALMALLLPGERAQAALADGTRVGTVTIGEAPTYASVVDEAAFLGWVRDYAPDMIVETVRGSFQAAILADCKAAGAPVTKHGELVPGVELRPGSASFRPSYNKDNLPAFMDAIRANGILAIEAP